MKTKRATSYDKDQHFLIAKALGGSVDPKASGLTAYEAVCILKMKLEAAIPYVVEPKDDVGILDFLSKDQEEVDFIKLYGTES